MSTTAAPAQSESTMSSPRDTKRVISSTDEPQPADPKAQPSIPEPARADQTAPAPAAPAPVAKTEDATVDNKPSTNAAQPLAPPPKPGQANNDGPDYFSGNHNQAHFSREPNPFEQSFGNPSTETPGRFPGLPSVASLTSPAPLGAAGTPGWQLGNSLRSGPLSPAMLTGPANASSYFDDGFRQSFPTPNESSLRTGLTPGGGGSMFPAPSPGTSAMFNSMSNNGLATPGTLDFHRTAINAAARSKVENNNMQTQSSTPIALKQEYSQQSQPSQLNSDPFNNHPDRDAVNSLYMLAQTGNRNANQFAVPPPPQSMRSGMQSQDTSPTTARGRPSVVGTDGSHSGDDDKGSGKGRKKSSAGKGSTTTNGRRKAEDMLPKQPAGKRAKGGNNMGMMPDMDDEDMYDEDDIKGEMSDIGPNGKKMTDEEKRKNFLERNRVAALKCRQRKKQWLANLQAKVEIFTSENDALNAQNGQLRDEIMNLKTLLLAHRDCPVSHQQGLAGNTMNQVIGADFTAQPNPYGMQMAQPGGQMQGQMLPGPGMQRN